MFVNTTHPPVRPFATNRVLGAGLNVRHEMLPRPYVTVMNSSRPEALPNDAVLFLGSRPVTDLGSFDQVKRHVVSEPRPMKVVLMRYDGGGRPPVQTVNQVIESLK